MAKNPLKDASHLSKTSLISSRSLSPGLATVDVQLETARPGAQIHFKHDLLYASVFKQERLCWG
ncbi:hypothetical protein QTG54_004257 [Skeletonema marinoi]|uniref:Uncharacterized protein n=1 Tax=Skeletonema marinoi TaxID=267567 RepID=A0AAD8YED2_9STRA|nr:hypothetical protein QTG54_004257 [Skeletonema marinoi]